jgi:hypothetical protein
MGVRIRSEYSGSAGARGERASGARRAGLSVAVPCVWRRIDRRLLVTVDTFPASILDEVLAKVSTLFESTFVDFRKGGSRLVPPVARCGGESY